MPYNARFLYQQPKTEINNYLIVNWFSLPLQTMEKHLVSRKETKVSSRENKSFFLMKLLFSHNETPSIIITMEVDDLPIELEVADALKSGHLMMGTAESCTGGKIASMITSMAGSSEYFTGGVVAYCNEVKHHVLGVSEADLNTFGAVSQPVVEQMARGTMRVLGCDCAVATSGIAGPGGGTPSKPVGTVWIAAAYKERILSECYHFGENPRMENIRLSAEAALRMLLRLIRE